MDKEILEILKVMQESIKSLDEGSKECKINKKLDGVVEQTANLLAV